MGYIVMECIGGGELFTHLRRARKFTDEQSKFYGARLVQHSSTFIPRTLSIGT